MYLKMDISLTPIKGDQVERDRYFTERIFARRKNAATFDICFSTATISWLDELISWLTENRSVTISLETIDHVRHLLSQDAKY